MKITQLTFDRVPRLPGIRAGDLTTVECMNPAPALVGWKLCLRGTKVYLTSPAGWLPQNAADPRNRDPKGPHVVYEFPRDNCFFTWTGDAVELEDVMKGSKYEQLLGPEPKPIEEGKAILDQIPPHQLGDR